MINGNLHSMFFEQFIKENADKLDVRGYMRKQENGRIEIFLEGNSDNVNAMAAICRRGNQHTQIRSVEEKSEKFQDFREFKILKI